MLLNTHKMYLALAIFTAASLPQGLHAAAYEESYPGGSPLFTRDTSGGPLDSSLNIRLFNPNGEPVYVNLAVFNSLISPVEGSLNSTSIYHLDQMNTQQVLNLLVSFNAQSTEGEWSFGRVGTSDVWFGEWNADADGTHNVFYAGPEVNGKADVSILSGNGITYSIKTISHYNGTAPTSTLTANFDAQTASATGDISFTNGQIQTYSLGSNYGGLTASNVSVASSGGTGGTLSGQFFGTDAAQVAGIVKFNDRNKDAAFGGSKN